MGKAVYDFLGYGLTEINYKNTHSKDNTYISICVINDKFDDIRKIYSFSVKITTDYDEKESWFIFETAFIINDISWFNSYSDNEKKSIFFSIVFPFIREKILSITSDIQTGLFIPIIDMKSIDLSKEFRLIKKKTINKTD